MTWPKRFTPWRNPRMWNVDLVLWLSQIFERLFYKVVNIPVSRIIYLIICIAKTLFFSSFAYRASTADQRYWIVQLSHLHTRALFPTKDNKISHFPKIEPTSLMPKNNVRRLAKEVSKSNFFLKKKWGGSILVRIRLCICYAFFKGGTFQLWSL